MSINRESAEAFAAQFEPPLKVVKTEHIDGRPIDDAWMCARSGPIGFTAVACHGRVFAWLEPAAGEDAAASFGRLVATALGMAKGA